MAENTAKDYTAYATKSPTATHEFYAQWIAEHVGVEVDVKGVQLAVNLYADFQRSPEWVAKRDELKAAADAAKLAAAATRKPGTSKAERAAKKIADALETLKAQGVDVSAFVQKAPVASATELPGNPVVEPGAVVDTPAEKPKTQDEIDELHAEAMAAQVATVTEVDESSPELDALNTDFASEKAAQPKSRTTPARRAPKTVKVPGKVVAKVEA